MTRPQPAASLQLPHPAEEGLKIDYDETTYEESLTVASKMKAGFGFYLSGPSHFLKELECLQCLV